MNRKITALVVMVFFLLSLSCAAGCTSVRTADTRDITVAVGSYNTWVSVQKELDRDVRSTITVVNDHVSIYNAEIAKDHPDYALLRENLATDRQLLEQLGSGLETLNAASDSFGQRTAHLNYKGASGATADETIGMMTQYMKIYAVNTANAREYLIDYVNNAEAYIGPDDPDYWNDNYRQKAMQAKDQAMASLMDGDEALKNITLQGRQLEKLQ